MANKLKTMKQLQHQKKTATTDKILKDKNRKKAHECLDHVHELYKKYEVTQQNIEDQRERQLNDKKQGLAKKISTLKRQPHNVGQRDSSRDDEESPFVPQVTNMSRKIAERVFDEYDVYEVLHNKKGEEVILHSPLKQRVRKVEKEGIAIGTKNHSRLHEHYRDARENKVYSNKPAQKKVVGLRTGEEELERERSRTPRKGHENAGHNNEKQRGTIANKLRDEDDKIVYVNYAGKKIKFSTEKKKRRDTEDSLDRLAAMDANKENDRDSLNNRMKSESLEAPDAQNHPEEKQVSFQGDPATDRDYQEDFDEELRLRFTDEMKESRNRKVAPAKMNNYLEEFLSKKVKKIGNRATVESLEKSELISQALARQTDERVFQVVTNIRRAAEEEEMSAKEAKLNRDVGRTDDDAHIQSTFLKPGVETRGQPLHNFDRSRDWWPSDAPGLKSTLGDDIMDAKLRREEEREREKEEKARIREEWGMPPESSKSSSILSMDPNNEEQPEEYAGPAPEEIEAAKQAEAKKLKDALDKKRWEDKGKKFETERSKKAEVNKKANQVLLSPPRIYPAEEISNEEFTFTPSRIEGLENELSGIEFIDDINHTPGDLELLPLEESEAHDLPNKSDVTPKTSSEKVEPSDFKTEQEIKLGQEVKPISRKPTIKESRDGAGSVKGSEKRPSINQENNLPVEASPSHSDGESSQSRKDLEEAAAPELIEAARARTQTVTTEPRNEEQEPPRTSIDASLPAIPDLNALIEKSNLPTPAPLPAEAEHLETKKASSIRSATSGASKTSIKQMGAGQAVPQEPKQPSGDLNSAKPRRSIKEPETMSIPPLIDMSKGKVPELVNAIPESTMGAKLASKPPSKSPSASSKVQPN